MSIAGCVSVYTLVFLVLFLGSLTRLLSIIILKAGQYGKQLFQSGMPFHRLWPTWSDAMSKPPLFVRLLLNNQASERSAHSFLHTSTTHMCAFHIVSLRKNQFSCVPLMRLPWDPACQFSELVNICFSKMCSAVLLSSLP